ncbi:hypothetical protein CEXT_4881 [Caerostris extrusa]|uniref:Uncharacterized protein n=1 Tax=Caerostris extrusa TaxID=172846 RepID=A0AAV4X7X6_CAEEX|nr:hypothetical protein CEXT_4881 [Caerostris extrusa]
MGSSKKHKEKRDKKKHKRERSRSREKDRESHKRSHKSSHRREKHRSPELGSPSNDFQLTKRRRISGEEEILTENKNQRPNISDDEFDVDKLLDSKLSENPEFSAAIKRSSRKRKYDELKKRNVFVENEDSLERFATEQLLEEHGVQDINVKSSHSPAAAEFSQKLSLEDVRIKEEPGSNSELNEPQPSRSTSNSKHRSKSSTKLLDSGNESPERQESQSSLSIEETNKLRAKLGLKPLDVTVETSDVQNEEKEISKPAAEIFVKTENIKKLRKTKGLADSDSEDESAAAW